MSQYANAVAERSYPLTLAYYHRTSPANNADGSSIMPMPLSSTQGVHHQSQNWPQYYAEHHSLPQPSNFGSSYGSSSGPSSSTTVCISYGDIHPTAPFVGAVGDISHFGQDQQSFNENSRPVQYQSSTQSPPLPDYPTSSQRTIMPPSPPPQLTTFSPLYRFRNNRDVSPSSHTSASDYGSGESWQSPGPTSDHLQYLQSRRGAGSPDVSSGQIAEGAERYPSLPASTTTDLPSQPAVKIEPDDPDGRFIMELSSFPDLSEDFGPSVPTRSDYRSSLLSQSLAPPTEVPLRATQASKEMRCMMGVFRLNPFAMHSLSVGADESMDGQNSPGLEGGKTQASWCGEARPLEEEPVILEFQLTIDGLEIEGEEVSPNGTVGKDDLVNLDIRGSQGLATSEGLRSFSPSFSLHSGDIDTDSDSHHRRGQRSTEHSRERDYENDQENGLWKDAEYSSRSEVDTSSTTTRSVHTPFYDSPQAQQTQVHGIYEPHHDQANSSPPSAWDAVNEQYLVEDNHFMSSLPTSLPAKAVMSYGHASPRVPRLHTTTSHPYLRKNQHNHQTTHGHSQSLSNAPSHSLSYVQPQPQSDISLLRLPTHHTQQNHVHTSSQYSQNHLPHPRQHHQSHIPSYPVPVMGSNNVIDDDQHLTGAIPPSYMRIRRAVQDEEPDYEQHVRVYTPSNASSAGNDIGVYSQATEPSMHTGSVHAAVNASAMNLASNRRWSLPETGTGIGHSMGHGGSFLSTT